MLKQRLCFSDSVKDQDKALAKLEIQRELSEAPAEKAVYQLAFSERNQESEGESVQHLSTGFGNIIDMFDQESYFSTQPFVTQPLNNVTQSLVPVTQPLVPVTVFNACNTASFNDAGFSLSSISILVRIPVLYYCFTVSSFRCTDITFCSQPINTCCTALALSHAQLAFIFNIYPRISVSVKLLLVKVIIKLLVKFVYSNYSKVPLDCDRSKHNYVYCVLFCSPIDQFQCGLSARRFLSSKPVWKLSTLLHHSHHKSVLCMLCHHRITPNKSLRR